ncbi:uncharacterized protein EHS24_008668 [Apiotrichum porosum]|uniref:Uncharacterized protein n=1 Tax=Apiotrichum porosum TaxID=105984 RepID=A0A427XR20_9TREE|nr:uncharacterized protein EHS24_008668 [Apiotrichum porosum]RSH81231.1 hypothetical protein EHS24_008668 [Apiotrichum porosum]
MEWAAKNATVAIHDGAWGVIVDKTYAVYLAVCDLVLQRLAPADHHGKDKAHLKDNGAFDLPYWPQWKADREQDIHEVFGWARRDLECHSGTLNYDHARRLCWRALYAVFWEGYDAEDGPPPTERVVPVHLTALGQFAVNPANLERYGLPIYQAAAFDEVDDRAVNSSVRD